MMKVIDLFSGCGGFSLGFIQAGFQITKAVEIDKDISKSYVKNHPNTLMINDDIRNIDNINFFKKNEVDIIIGGPPCQGFSMAGARNRKDFIDDDRNYLFKHYFNIVSLVKPKIFIMENVKGILSMQNGKVFQEIKEMFSEPCLLDGDFYRIYPILTNSYNFGIPQRRERVIIIGILNKDVNINYFLNASRNNIMRNNPTFFDKVTIKDALSNLPLPNESGEVIICRYEGKYQEYLRGQGRKTFNHTSTKHSSKAIDRIKKLDVDQNFKNLDEKINSIHSGSYGRLNYSGISNTITTRFDTPSGGKFIHPEYNRTLTPREAARIQSFPDDFHFIGSKTSVCKQIGNAVPVKIAYFYANVAKDILYEYFN